MINSKHKKAFSMITAIFVIVIMASITSMIMSVTAKTIKATTAQYQKEQATLLARSYTELAIFYALYYDRNTTNSCLEKITDHFGDTTAGYGVEINIKYIGNNSLLNGCNTSIDPSGGISNLNATWSDNSGGFYNTISLIIDTYISYKDFDDPQNRNVTFHRRTLQKL
ncbi:MAG: Unknown protein [uncultured Sulfurovum sp.]|uniref:Type II secretion system protein n=1 Tax=uncultured Sulfurovum sp. TaxID=269237 RepID=A0A6S6TV75_9BACT|nr:MAG: Unknown protein [uncultured Sulfurovum sp.]